MDKKIKKRIIASIVAIAVIITSVNLTDIFGTNDKNASESGKKLESFVEQAIELTSEDNYEGDSKYQTKRLIVTSEKDDFDDYGAIDKINYGNIFVLSYENESDCKTAYKGLSDSKEISSVEIDAVMEIETKKVTDKDIEKALKISKYSDNDKKSEDIFDNYDTFNINGLDEEKVNNVDKYIKAKKLKQKDNIIVAIIDSGLDRSAVKENRYIDTKTNLSGEGSVDDISDNNGHGTSMAKIITEQTEDNIKIMPVKTVNSEGKCSILSAYLGIKHAIENKADIINISLNTVASTNSIILENVIKEAEKKGIEVVVSAGNNTDDVKHYTPSNIEEAFVISATDENGTLTGYSNFGKTVDYASCGIYEDEEGTSIAAANFSAGIAALKGTGVKELEAVLDEIVNFTEDSEKSLFLGKGYIGNERHIITKNKKPIITGTVPKPADIRNLKDGAWKELSDSEFDEYVKGSSYTNIGAFLSTLTKEELKEAVNKSENLRMEQLTYSGKKLLRKNRKFEEALFCYSRIVDTLTTSDYEPDFLTGEQPVWIGGKNKENNTTSYCQLSKVTIDSYNIYDTHLNITECTFGVPQNNSASGITLSNFGLNSQSNGETWQTDSTFGQIYFALWGQFTSTVPNYYQTTANDVEKSYSCYGEKYDDDGNVISRTTVYRLNFGTYAGANEDNGWNGGTTIIRGADTNNRTMTHSFQINLLHCGITCTTESGNYATYTGNTISQIYFLIERPKVYMTPQAGEGITSISPASTEYRKGDTAYTSACSYGIATGYDYPTDLPSNVMLDNWSPTIAANPHPYNFNYYHNAPSGMTLDDGLSDPYTTVHLFNKAFTWQGAIFKGHYNLTLKSVPLSSDTDKPTVSNGESFQIREMQENEEPWTSGIVNGSYTVKYQPTDPVGINPTPKNDKNSEKINTSVASWKWNNTNVPLNKYEEKNSEPNDRNIYAVWDNGKYPELPTPEMKGFTFKGWYTSRSYDPIIRGYNGCGSKVTSNSAYSHTNDTTLYGKWKRNEYTVTYDYGTNGGYQAGSNGAVTTRTETVPYDWPVDTTLDAEKSTDDGTYTEEQKNNNLAPGVYDFDKNPDGWEFIGWSEDPDATEEKEANGQCKIYKIASKGELGNVYKVKDNSGKYQKDEFGRYIQTNNWNYAENGSPKQEDYITDELLMGTKDITLYAIYKKTIAFNTTDANTEISSYDYSRTTPVITVLYGNEHSVDVTIPTPSESHYAFHSESELFVPWETIGWADHPNTVVEGEKITIPYTEVKYNSDNYGQQITISKNYSLYAVYNREITATFVSHGNQTGGIEPKIITRAGKQYVNSSYSTDFTEVEITAPTAYKFNGDPDNGSWSQNYWLSAENTHKYKENISYIEKADIQKQQGTIDEETEQEYQDKKKEIEDIPLKNGTTFKIKSSTVYYALYDRNIHVSYTYYNGNTKISDEKQYVRQYALSSDTDKKPETLKVSIDQIGYINEYSNPLVLLKNIAHCNAWPKACYWTNSTSALSHEYDEGEIINISKNLNLYAVYERNINAIFKDYDGAPDKGIQTRGNTESESKPQKANAYNFDDTKEPVSFSSKDIRSFTDDRNYLWTGEYWSTSADKTKNAPNSISTNPFTIRDTTTYYGIYKTLYNAEFISISGSLRSSQTISEYAWLNTNNIENQTNPVITAPNEQKCDIDARAWVKKGWATDDAADAETVAAQGEKITLKNNITYYGRYDISFNAKLIDYNGTVKTTRTVPAIQSVSASTLRPTEAILTMPALNTCTVDNRTWNAVGWTRSSDSFEKEASPEEEFGITKEDTFYGIYRSQVNLEYIAYNNSVKPANSVGLIYMNSYNKNNIKKAKENIVNPVNINGWEGLGWSTKTTAGGTPELSTGSVFEYDKDTTLYGIYTKDITVKYMYNDGTNNQFGDSQTGSVQINASDTSNVSPANIAIYTDEPYRSSCQFMGLWGNAPSPTKTYVPGTSYPFTSNTTLYAQWELPTINKTITIQWEDANNANKTRPDKVYLKLYRDGELASSYLVSKPLNITKPSTNTVIDAMGTKVSIGENGNDFIFTYEGLQRYAEDGHAYRYTVEEEPVESLINGLMYTTSYPSDGVIKNTLVNTDGVKMNVAIRWDDGLNAWHIRPSSVNISLIQTDPDSKEEKTIKVANIKSEATKESQVYTFNNVPLMNGNQKMYEYKVRQDWISGYSTTYGVTENVDGITTFPVYNTSSGLPTLYGENYIIFSADAFSSDTGNQATGKDYLNVDINEDEPILITLRQIHKSWSDTGVGASESYDNNRYMHNDVNGTDVSYNVIVSPRVDTRLVKIPFGRYELDVHNHALFDFENFTAANYEKVNADLDTINGKQYVTFSARYSSGAIAKLHANFLIANWRGYTSMKRMYQPLDYSVVQVRMPGIYNNLGKQIKTWNLMKIDGDMNLNGTTFSLASKTHIDGELIIDKAVETIDVNGLANQNDMIKLTLPDNLKKVNGNAFLNCSRLRIVTYQGVQYVNNDALKEAFRRNGVTFADSAFTGVALGY